MKLKLWDNNKRSGLLLLLALAYILGALSMLLIAISVNHAASANQVLFANQTPNPSPLRTFAAKANRSTPTPSPTPTSGPALKPSAKLEAPMISQLPELYNGCEVTSLAMLLQYYQIDIDKMDLAQQMKVDPTKLRKNVNGEIESWGNPEYGFVGDVTGAREGYGIYHKPLFQLLQNYIPSAIDLTNHDFTDVEEQISLGMPVIVWTTIDYEVPYAWITWITPEGTFRGTMQEHAVLLVGYDQSSVYVNDPLSGQKDVQVNKAQFLKSWKAMGSQALSYQPSNNQKG